MENKIEDFTEGSLWFDDIMELTYKFHSISFITGTPLFICEKQVPFILSDKDEKTFGFLSDWRTFTKLEKEASNG